MCNNDNYDNTDDKDISSQNSTKSGLSLAIYLKKKKDFNKMRIPKFRTKDKDNQFKWG